MFLQVILNVLDNFIESLHISMSLGKNTRDMYILCYTTELFLICIPALQCKLVGIIDGTLHINDPGRLLQTINIGNFKVK